jgi:hypothetical protein
VSTGLELWPAALAIGAVVRVARRRRRSRATQQGAGPSMWQAAADPSPSAEVLTVPTRAKDAALLAQALDGCGRHFATEDGVVYGELGGHAVAFVAEADGRYEAHLDGTGDPAAAVRLVGDLDDEYALRLQQQSYTKLLERAPLHGLSFESREVEGDDIIVTLRVGEEAR